MTFSNSSSFPNLHIEIQDYEPTITFSLLFILSLEVFSQQGKLGISRIDHMPDSPPSLSIRDWDAVAKSYDELVFDLTKTGTHLPLSKTGTPGQFNYSGNTHLSLDS